MTYRVVLQRLAVEDLNAAYLHVAGHAPKTAARWFERFQAALQTLDQRPDRCPFAPEKRKVGIEITRIPLWAAAERLPRDLSD